MILVTGHLVARPETFDQLLALSLEHVRRSRAEPGCVAHHVHCDAEDPMRLVFVEKWADHPALEAHFALPASKHFVREAVSLSAAPPLIEVFEAAPLEFGVSGG